MPDLRSQLPEHLRERTIVIGAGRTAAPAPAPAPTSAPADAPPFVMYWMRTSARAHDNPALDVARAAAEAMGLPVFVYLGLSERHPYSSARHHWFFIEGARDVEAECAELGLGFAFNLERTGNRGPHLLTLAQQAALVVTEDLPVSPLEAWSAELASQINAPVWAVDAACTWPMRKVAAKETLRAFKFRKVTERQRLERIRAGWPTWEPGEAGAPSAAAPSDGAATIPFVPELPFEPVRLAHLADDELQRAIAELISTCRIDHGVAPVPHTRGGSRAGYARWDTFKAKGLRHYHRTRNDPLRDGVSRMSAYLHFGHVSPFRVAREALEIAEGHDAGGQRDEGAEKYLDELLTWRELAHSWCAHHADRDSLNAIPSWARETLATHERDPRPALFSWESLARARTGDMLWDAAQQSLLIHGELHNNVRMTWGKALLGWTRTADEALAKLIDLNHRYALDGRDPASYGGLLWCLGQFDRPFEPEERIIGTVRPRPTDHHVRRLNAAEYSRRTGRPAIAEPPRVAVIGAGISGLACARTLRDHGIEVRVFDKGRRPGGRLATRESRDQTGVFFDHGAQYFTAHDDRFARYVASWAEDGVVAPWHGQVVDISADGAIHERPAATPCWVGVGGMNAVAAHVASDVEVECGVRVDGLTRREDGWWLTVEWLGERDAKIREVRAPEVGAPEVGPFDAIVLTAPPVQAVPLLSGADAPELQAAAESAEMLPCWTLMVEFAAPLGVDFEGARFVAGNAQSPSTSDGALAWIKRQGDARNNAGRDIGERWVLQATAEWSAEHLERDAAEVEAAMLADLATRLSELRGGQALPELLHTSTHRWRYARPHIGPGSVEDESRIMTDERGLVLAGDWVTGTAGARVEAAWLSGVAAAGHLLTSAIAAPLDEGAERGGPPCFASTESDKASHGGDAGSDTQHDLFA